MPTEPKRVLEIMLETPCVVAAISRGSELPEEKIRQILRKLISEQTIERDAQR